MFLQYAAPGAMVPLFSLRLQELGFTPLQMGLACSMQAFGALIGPLVAGQVADRWWPAERCLAVCALLAGGLLWWLAELSCFPAVCAVTLAFWMVAVPTTSLGAALTLGHLADPERQYGGVRLWGTVGWVVPGWLLLLWFQDPLRLGRSADLADAFRLGGCLALLLAGYALTLPHTAPQRGHTGRSAPRKALRLARRRAFAIYLFCTFGLCVTLPFTTQVTPLLLQHLGIAKPWLMPTLTIAQGMEIAALALLPMALLRLGIRGTMVLGLSTWTAALMILTVGWPLWLVVSSLALNGFCISFYLVAGQVFVNSQASRDIRASAQGLLSFTSGIGLLVGNLLVALVRQEVHGEFLPTFAVGATIAMTLALIFFLEFPSDEALPAAADKAATGGFNSLVASGSPVE